MGRLKHFQPALEKITRDQWLFDLIRNGCKLEFIQKPPFSGIIETKVNQESHSLIHTEIQNLLDKNVIGIVPKHQTHCGFYSMLFLVPKRTENYDL